jgi:molybdopterin converting factor small subunit
MITVKVELLGPYRLETGIGETQWELPEGSTLGDLLEALSSRFGGGIKSLLLDATGQVRQTMAVAVDGRILPPDRTLSYALRDGQTVLFLSPAMGG